MFFRIIVLKKFANSTGTLASESALIIELQALRTAILLKKRNSGKDVFL